MNAAGITEGLLVAAAHHRAHAAKQHRSTDHTGRRCRRGSEERPAATAERRLRLTISGLTITGLGLTILAAALRLLHHLARVPDRAAAHAGGAHVRYRALRCGALRRGAVRLV